MADPPETDWTRQRLGREEVGLAVTRAYHGFLRHRGLDSAAALSFFNALALFPISLSIVSTVAILDSRSRAPGDILRVIAGVAPHTTIVALRGPLQQLLSIPNPGYALATGLVLGLWTLSGYATAVGRALNRAYEVEEGRRWFGLRVRMLVVAIALFVIGTASALLILGTPTIAAAVARSRGVPGGVVVAWDIAKWPILAALAIFAIAILYFYSPNVRHLRIRWVTSGALLAIVTWVLATTGFAIYVLNLSHYNRVYGWLGGAVVLLLWLYLSNLVIVAGAEMDAEFVRVRQLRAGIHSEKEIQLPLRSTRRIETLDRWQKEDQRKGLLLRRRSSK